VKLHQLRQQLLDSPSLPIRAVLPVGRHLVKDCSREFCAAEEILRCRPLVVLVLVVCEDVNVRVLVG
jgi:hypothetical protein